MGAKRVTWVDVVSASVLSVASAAAVLVSAVESQHMSSNGVVTPAPPAPMAQPVKQDGTLVAVTANSVTARSANGYTQTYLVTPNTGLFAGGGSQFASATSCFKVNDEVEIVGTIQGGTALATAVADREATRGAGPPMDYVEGQPVSVSPGRP